MSSLAAFRKSQILEEEEENNEPDIHESMADIPDENMLNEDDKSKKSSQVKNRSSVIYAA
jgi:hypothetical protein